MKKMQQLYRAAPRRQSPEALDQRILKHAELQAARNSRTVEKPRALSSAWMPFAATAVVALLSVTLVLRNPGQDLGNLSIGTDDTANTTDADGSSTAASAPAPEMSDGALANGTVMPLEAADEQLHGTDEARPALDTQQESESVGSRQLDREAAVEKRIARVDADSETTTATAGLEPLTIAESEASTAMTTEDMPKSVAPESTDSDLVAEVQRAEQRQERIRPSQATNPDLLTGSLVPNQALNQLQDQAQVQTQVSEELHRVLPAPVSGSVRNPAVTELAVTELAPSNSAVAASESISPDIAVRAAAVESNSRRELIFLVGQGSVDWLNEQPETHYLLQLASADDENYLLEFADGLSSELRARQIAVVPVSPSLYTLLVGGFASFSDAETALSNLPNNARKFGARVRNVAILQQSLR